METRGTWTTLHHLEKRGQGKEREQEGKVDPLSFPFLESKNYAFLRKKERRKGKELDKEGGNKEEGGGKKRIGGKGEKENCT